MIAILFCWEACARLTANCIAENGLLAFKLSRLVAGQHPVQNVFTLRFGLTTVISKAHQCYLALPLTDMLAAP